MKKILFLNDCNGFEHYDPLASLVEISETETLLKLRSLETNQLGVSRRGGSWKEIMVDGKIPYSLIKEGRKSDFKKEDYDTIYYLISGNY